MLPVPQTLSILIYGRDPYLLGTRRLVLESSGHRVWAIEEISEMDRIASDEAIDLLILCHSLSAAQCSSALAVGRGRWPSAQSLILTVGEWGSSDQSVGQSFDVGGGPAKLIAAVDRIGLARHSSPPPAVHFAPSRGESLVSS